MAKSKPAETIFASAGALARELGISDLEIGKAALGVAIGIAHEKGDPDGYLALLTKTATKGKSK